MRARRALITGITGQDGSYLAELLLEKGYEVHGTVRRVAIEDPEHRMFRIRHLLGSVELHSGGLESYPSIFRTILRVQPDECYHLAAQSFVSYSFDDEFSALTTNINGTHHVLAAIKEACPTCRFYFAGTSEMFGNALTSPQNEETPFRARSVYGISKVAGFELTRNYRDAGLHASSGLLYNHESPRRGFEYVTRKITRRVAQIAAGLATDLPLGNLESRRDWGHAADYVRAMWLMLQQERPGDYVVATGETHSVREFCALAFGAVGLDFERYVTRDDRFYRPAEAVELRGDATRARTRLGWAPTHTFEALVREMVATDVDQLRQDALRPDRVAALERENARLRLIAGELAPVVEVIASERDRAAASREQRARRVDG
jgi:GDPmannose 4,6-dehydratase